MHILLSLYLNIVLFVIYVTTILRWADVLLHYVTLLQDEVVFYNITT